MNWNLETMTKEQAILILLPSPDHIQMPSCDLLCLNTIFHLSTRTGKRNLVYCICDNSQGGDKSSGPETELQPRWLGVSGVRCNPERKPWQPSSSKTWWWAWLCKGAEIFEPTQLAESWQLASGCLGHSDVLTLLQGSRQYFWASSEGSSDAPVLFKG